MMLFPPDELYGVSSASCAGPEQRVNWKWKVRAALELSYLAQGQLRHKFHTSRAQRCMWVILETCVWTWPGRYRSRLRDRS